MKMAIVGAREDRWTKEQKEKVKRKIKEIIMNYYIEHDNYGQFEPELEPTLVSGHCPVGNEMWYCVDCNGWDGNGVEPDPHPSHTTQRSHRTIKVYDKGGVDTWAEIIACKLGIKTEIYPPEVNQWENKRILNPEYGSSMQRYYTLRGYKSRNIQIAEACDVLYCITPKSETAYCRHCKVYGHIQSGGCWTLKKTKELGKSTFMVVIE